MPGRRHQLAAAITLLALVTLLGLGVERWSERRRVEEVLAHVTAIQGAVGAHHARTGRWLPLRWSQRTDGAVGAPHIYPDPFTGSTDLELPGLAPDLFEPASNHGLLLQLVRFSPETDLGVGASLLTPALAPGDPYLRILLGYGPGHRAATHLVDGLIARLGRGHATRVGDHVYVVDVRSQR